MPFKDIERRRAAVRKWNAKNRKKLVIANRKWRDANPGKAAAVTKRWREANPEEAKKLDREYRARYPRHVRARATLGRAVRSGKIVRQPCEGCGTKKKVQGHHDDYSKPLEVSWLCAKCHGIQHREEVIMAAKKKTLTAKQQVKAEEKKQKAEEAKRIAKIKRKAPRQLFVTLDGEGGFVDVTGSYAKKKDADDNRFGDEIVLGPYVLTERVRNE